MDLSFTSEQDMLRDSAARFLSNECPYEKTKEIEEKWLIEIVKAGKKRDAERKKWLDDFFNRIEKEGYPVRRGKSRKLE